jgi:hypothetical protein
MELGHDMTTKLGVLILIEIIINFNVAKEVDVQGYKNGSLFQILIWSHSELW